MKNWYEVFGIHLVLLLYKFYINKCYQLGVYLSRQLRMGRGVTIPKFGIFTFSAPEIKLNVIYSLILFILFAK